jgi:glutaredoxin
VRIASEGYPAKVGLHTTEVERQVRMAPRDHSVALVTRAGCHLCAEAEQQLRALSAELGFGYREVDVDASPALRAEYSDRVPVILLDGREHGYWRVEEQRLRRALSR